MDWTGITWEQRNSRVKILQNGSGKRWQGPQGSGSLRDEACSKYQELSHSTLLPVNLLKGWKAKTLISQTLAVKVPNAMWVLTNIHFVQDLLKLRKGADFWLLLLFPPASTVVNTCSCGITPWAAGLVGRAQSKGHRHFFCWCGSSRHNMPLLRTWRSSFLIPESGKGPWTQQFQWWFSGLLTFLIVAMQQLPDRLVLAVLLWKADLQVQWDACSSNHCIRT